MLKFDPKFAERSIEDQLAYLHKLCGSQNTALDLMQTERDEWRRKATRLEAAVKNAEDAFYIQKDIVKNLVTQTNANGQDTNNRIRDLERKVGELGGSLD